MVRFLFIKSLTSFPTVDSVIFIRALAFALISLLTFSIYSISLRSSMTIFQMAAMAIMQHDISRMSWMAKIT